jgi:hypothetical protein
MRARALCTLAGLLACSPAPGDRSTPDPAGSGGSSGGLAGASAGGTAGGSDGSGTGGTLPGLGGTENAPAGAGGMIGSGGTAGGSSGQGGAGGSSGGMAGAGGQGGAGGSSGGAGPLPFACPDPEGFAWTVYTVEPGRCVWAGSPSWTGQQICRETTPHDGACDAFCTNYVRVRAPQFGEPITIAIVATFGSVQEGSADSDDPDYNTLCAHDITDGVAP